MPALKEKILYVDDEEINLQNFSMLFKNDYDIVTAKNGDEALKKLAIEDEISLVLADQRMPGLTGTELLARCYEEYPDVMRVILTAFNDSQAAIEAINQAHIYQYILKPYKKENIRLVIDNALDLRNAKLQNEKLQEEKYIKEQMLLRSERLASLGELSAAIGHEIRQPLHIIKIITDSMQMFGGKDCKDMEKCFKEPQIKENCLLNSRNIGKISDAVDWISKIISNMQKMLRKSETIEITRIDPNGIIRETIGFFIQRIKFHRIKLELELDEEAGTLRFSEVQLRQILTNMLNNAIDAHDMSDKGDKRIIIRTGREDNTLILEIEDNGPGIPDSEKELIFNPMYSTKSSSESMGLGLFLVHNILETFDASIEVKDADKNGTVFHIRIPDQDLQK